MRQSSLSFLLISFLLVSCSITSNRGRFSENQYAREYEIFLTNEAREKLNQGKEAFIIYNSEDPAFSFNDGENLQRRLRKGTVRVFPPSEEKRFHYVEIGEWHEDLIGGFTNDWITPTLMQLKTESLFDSLGNIITQKVFVRHEEQEKLFLSLETVHHEEFINGKQFHLYHVKYYSESGKLWEDVWFNNIEYNNPKSDLNKKRIMVKHQIKYKKDGGVESEKYYDMEGNLISKKKY